MSLFIPSGRTLRPLFSAVTLALILTFFGFSLGAQTTCSVTATVPTVHAEGYAEQIGTYTYSCNGGTPGAQVQLVVFAAVGANITNRLDGNGVPTGITVTTSPGVFTSGLTMYAASTIELSQVSYVIPNPSSTPVTISIAGIRAAVAMAANGTTGAPVVNGSALVIGAAFNAPASFPVAQTTTTLLSSSINNGIPCTGSPLPSSIDFPTFLTSGAVGSAIRITEGSAAAFLPKAAGTDTGVRILVNLSGYSSGSRVFVPDVIVGSDAGAVPTSDGLYGITPNPGSYTPGNNELLLIRVMGADSTGNGGTFVLPTPTSPTTFSSVSELKLTGGATYAVYEVVDSNPGVVETAQIPLWVVAPATACNGNNNLVLPTYAVQLAPVSTVSVATATDPIPRFMSVTPGTDCTAIGDCSAGYFPTLSVTSTPLVFTAPSLGAIQSNTIAVGNSGGGVLGFTVAVTYQSGSGWLTVSPTSGQNTATLNVTANPAALQPGAYNATITVTAGTQTASVPVTFNVGPVGVNIQNVGNAASFQYGTVAPGSYAVIFGLNLQGASSTSVTFNSVPATIVYTSATQINVLVPTNLTNSVASVVVTADGMASNSFRVNLANFPGIFSNGVVNFADGQSNVAADPVTRGNILVVYLTGLILPLTGPVTVNIGSQTNLMPSYSGPQGTFPGLDQVNITVPLALPATPNPVPLTVCVGGGAAQACSNPINVYLK